MVKLGCQLISYNCDPTKLELDVGLLSTLSNVREELFIALGNDNHSEFNMQIVEVEEIQEKV